MKIENVKLFPEIRELPVLLNIKKNAKYELPINNNGYIINPEKFRDQIKDEFVNIDDIKTLLLMMLKGNADFIKNLIRTEERHFVNIEA